MGVILELGACKGFVLLVIWPALWSDGNLVNIDQSNHYVVLGTKSGAMRDFQKKCHTVQQAPLQPPQKPSWLTWLCGCALKTWWGIPEKSIKNVAQRC